MTKTSLFISYAREDINAARRLYHSLRTAGLTPWLDVECLQPGQQWKVAIRRAIKQSRYFLVLLSSHSVSRKGFVHKELTDALEILDMYPDSEIYLIPVRLDLCEPPRERLRDLQWVDLFPDWDIGLAKLRSSLLLENASASGEGTSGAVEPLVIVLEKYRDSTAHGPSREHSSAELYFSLKNAGTSPLTIYDLGLQQLEAGSVAHPALHAFGCRVTLDACLARKGESGETIPLFSAWCFECYLDELGFSEHLTPERAREITLRSPHRHEESLFFHSVIGRENVLTLAPFESESFLLRLAAEPGCATVMTQFKICALYHDVLGNMGKVLSRSAYTVQLERDTTFIRQIES